MTRRKYPEGPRPPRDPLRPTLEILGYTVEAAAFSGCKNVLRGTRLVMMGTDDEIWQWLRRSGQIVAERK